MIEVTGLYKRYGSKLAVNNVSFTINDGEVIGFLGPNGAGKSTIMNILTGYLSLTAGSASIDGYDIMTQPLEAKRRIGYLPEIPPLYPDMTVREYLYFIYDLKKVKFPRKPHIDEICSLVMIERVADRLIKNLSKGYRQRVGIAQALIGNPDVLILDEPTVGLDPKQIIEIRNLITRLGKNHTVILSSHILSEIQAVCNRIIIINKGRLVADGTPQEISESLSSGGALTARVAGPESEVVRLISSIPGVESVNVLAAREKNAVDLEISSEGDIRRELCARLAERNWPIYSLEAGGITLEQIFLRLTEEASTADEEEETEEIPEETTEETTEEIPEETTEEIPEETTEPAEEKEED